MRESVCMVTGATSGIGLATARELARQGATVVIVGRHPARCQSAVMHIREQTGNARVDFLLADLSAQADVRRLAEAFMARYTHLHVLVNNAGGLFLNGQVAPDGTEMTLALNHLGYYLLTRLLLDRLQASAPARVVNVASAAHIGVHIDFTDLRFGGWTGYQRSKLANILFTYELARRLAGTGVTVNTLHPGLVDSGFGRNNRGLFSWIRPVVYALALDNDRGARTSVYLASSPDVARVTGQYFVRCRPRRSSAATYDRRAAARLWEVSAKMTGLPPD